MGDRDNYVRVPLHLLDLLTDAVRYTADERKAKRLVEVADLVDTVTISERAGVARNTVSMWSNRYDGFPAPVFANPRCTVYLWSEIEAWLVATHRIRAPHTEVPPWQDAQGA